MSSTIISSNVSGSQVEFLNLFPLIRVEQPKLVLLQEKPQTILDQASLLDSLGLSKVAETDCLAIIGRATPTHFTESTDLYLAVKLELAQRETLVINAYFRPSCPYADFSLGLSKIGQLVREHSNSRIILAGDFNASDPTWAPLEEVCPINARVCIENTAPAPATDCEYIRLRANRGKLIANLIGKLHLKCLNKPSDPATFKDRSHIDLMVVGQRAERTWNQLTCVDVDNDHRALVLRDKASQANSTPHAPNSYANVYKYKAIRDTHFECLRLLHHDNYRNWSSLNHESKCASVEASTWLLVDNLLSIQHSIRTRRKVKSDLDSRTAATIARLKRRLNLAAASRLSLNDRMRFRRGIRGRITRLIARKTLKNSENLDLWARLNRLSRATSEAGTSHGRDLPETQLHTLPDTQADLNALAARHFHEPFNGLCSIDGDEQNCKPSDEMKVISLQEVREAVWRCRHKTYSGPDGLKFKTLLKCFPFIENIVYDWVRAGFEICHVPNYCKQIRGKLIPKKQVGTYRVVHISSPLTAILERVALARLNCNLERNGHLSPNQFGFVAKVDRADLIARLMELVIKSDMSRFPRRNCSTIVALDVRGAFDNVDQEILRQRLLHELAPDALRYWLHNFTLNRRIQLSSGQLTSSWRRVTKGVPQGSALGPIMWNFAINKLAKQLRQFTNAETELLCYADDLFVVYTGRCQVELQATIDKIVELLAEIKLELDPRKCEWINLRLRSREDPVWAIKDLRVSGELLASRDCITILGVSINNKLRFNLRGDGELSSRLMKRISLLNTIKRARIVHTAREWRILINSYLVSILTSASFPLYAFDKRAPKAVQALLHSALKTIFDWPSNVSNKLIDLTLSLDHPSELAWIALNHGLSGAHSESYRLLVELSGELRLRDFYTKSDLPIGCRRTQALGSHSHARRYYNPICLPTYQSFRELSSARNSIVWVLVEQPQSCFALEATDSRVVLQTLEVRHSEHAHSYFNSMGLLMHLASNFDTANRVLLGHGRNPALLAIKNLSNKDYRVVELREKLASQGWTLVHLSDDQWDSVKLLATANVVETEQSSVAGRASFVWATWPQVDDYQLMFNAGILKKREKLRRLREGGTSLTRMLSTKLTVWSNLVPSWLSGQRMLMLSGLVTQGGQLMKDHDLQCECTNTSLVLEGPRYPSILMHRLKHCPMYRAKRAQLREVFNRVRLEDSRWSIEWSVLNPWQGEDFHQVLKHKRYSQTLIRLLADMAFERTSDEPID